MKKTVLIIAVVFFTALSYAQLLQNRYEFSIWGGGGMSSLRYKPALGNYEAGYGGFAGIGYSYFFDYHWSIGTGLEFSLLKESITFPWISDTYIASAGNSKLHWILVEGKNFSQTQETYYVNIPLMFRVQFPIEHGHNLYFSAGPKIGIPVKSSFNARGTFKTTGVEVDYVNEHWEPVMPDWYNGMSERGFFSDSAVSVSSVPVSLKNNVILSFEAGVKWRLSSRYSLYSGIFLDYGLPDIRKGDLDKHFFEYNRFNQPVDYTLNNVLHAQYTPPPPIQQLDKFPDESPRPFVDKVNTFAIGIKVQLSIGSGLFEKKRGVYVNSNPPFNRPVENITVQQKEEAVEDNKNVPVERPKIEYGERIDLANNEEPDFEGSVGGFNEFSDNITQAMYPFLDKKVYWLKKYPDVNLLIVGHADESGSDNFNYLLGNDRANAVKNYLVSKGISESRLTTMTEGKTQPVVSKASKTARASNRRVEFVLQSTW